MKKRSWLQMSYTMPYWDSDPSWFDMGTTEEDGEEEDYQPPPVSLNLPGLLPSLPPPSHRLTPPNNNNNSGEGEPEPRYRDTTPRTGVSEHSGPGTGVSAHYHNGPGAGRSAHSGPGVLPPPLTGGNVTEGRLPLHPLTSPETYPHAIPRQNGPSLYLNNGDASMRAPYQLK